MKRLGFLSVRRSRVAEGTWRG